MQILFGIIFLCFLIWILIYGIFLFAKETCQIFFWNWVPYVTTNNTTTSLLLQNLQLEADDIFIDIGCGDGKILEMVSKKFPKNNVIWFEISPRPYRNALSRKKRNNWTYQIYNTNFFETNISEASILYSYTIGYIMKDIWQKIQHDCRKGTKLYSNYFQVPWIIPSQVIQWPKNQNIYLYIL